MQKAITLHPNQHLILIREQKQIIHELNSNGGLFFPMYPLWIFLKSKEFENPSPKEISLSIKSLRIEGACIYGDTLFFPVRVTISDGTIITEELVAAKIKKLPVHLEYTSNFSMDCKIFKISEVRQNKATHVYELWNSLWRKIT